MAYTGPVFDFSNLNANWLDQWRKENQDREQKTAAAYNRVYQGMDALGKAGQYAREQKLKEDERALQKKYMEQRMDMIKKGYDEYLKGLEDPELAEKRRAQMATIGINPDLFSINQTKWGMF